MKRSRGWRRRLAGGDDKFTEGNGQSSKTGGRNRADRESKRLRSHQGGIRVQRGEGSVSFCSKRKSSEGKRHRNFPAQGVTLNRVKVGEEN